MLKFLHKVSRKDAKNVDILRIFENHPDILHCMLDRTATRHYDDGALLHEVPKCTFY